MTASKRVLTAARLDLKRNFLPHLCLALLLVLLTPVLFGLNDLDTQGSAVPLELMMPLTGILLLTPIFLPEQGSRCTGCSSRTLCPTVADLQCQSSLFLTIPLFASCAPDSLHGLSAQPGHA